MKLYDLKIGEIGLINNKNTNCSDKTFLRLQELGFVNGEKVLALFKTNTCSNFIFRIKNYEISLNKEEASLIDIIKEDCISSTDSKTTCCLSQCDKMCFLRYKNTYNIKKNIKVILVGNPNCGKTTLFNFISHSHEHVGNFANVTIDFKLANIIFNNYKIEIVDLPGIYSLNNDNDEEKCTVDYIFNNKPDIIINVLDTTKLERSLYLTNQLQQINIPVICAFNFFDKFEKYDFKINLIKFKETTGIDCIPIVSDTGFGVKRLFDKVIEIYDITNENKDICKNNENNKPTILNIEENYKKVRRILEETEYLNGSEKYKLTTHLLDKIFLHPYYGLFSFYSFIFITFFSTFYLGQMPTNFLNFIIENFTKFLTHMLPNCLFSDLITDGIIGSIGSLIIFLPQIFILYCFITLFEESGYANRATILIDNFMHKIGLHGESLIPIISGFGCNVPAILLTKTIKNKKNRLITALIIPMMSCPAKLPIYLLLSSLFFNDYMKIIFILCIYTFGFLIGILVSKILNKFIEDKNEYFINEIQDYQMPSISKIFKASIHKCKHFLKNIGFIILLSGIILWCLKYFPHNNLLTKEEQLEQSYIGIFGKKIEPFFKPLGFNWKLSVPLVAGIGAKEIIAPSVTSLYNNKQNYNDQKQIKENMEYDGIKLPEIISFLIFVLFYFPCFGTLSAIAKEIGIKYSIISLLLNTTLAYTCSFVFLKIYNYIYYFCN